MKSKLLFKIIISLSISVLFLTSCEDEQYQKYKDIQFDSELVGSWVKKGSKGKMVYQPYLEIGEGQDGIFNEVIWINNDNGGFDYDLKKTKARYRLTKGNILIAVREGEKAAIHLGYVEKLNSDSIVLIVNDISYTRYNPKFLDSKGYEETDIYEWALD